MTNSRKVKYAILQDVYPQHDNGRRVYITDHVHILHFLKQRVLMTNLFKDIWDSKVLSCLVVLKLFVKIAY